MRGMRKLERKKKGKINERDARDARHFPGPRHAVYLGHRAPATNRRYLASN